MPAVCSMMALSLRGGREYSVKLPLVVIRRMLLGPPVSDNPPAHSAPSGPAAMAKSTKVDEIGLGYSVIDPVVVMRPTLLLLPVNHNAPSGPVVIPPSPPPLGITYCVNDPEVVIFPM